MKPYPDGGDIEPFDPDWPKPLCPHEGFGGIEGHGGG